MRMRARPNSSTTGHTIMVAGLSRRRFLETAAVAVVAAEARRRTEQEPAHAGLPWMTREQLLAVPGLQAVLVETAVARPARQRRAIHRRRQARAPRQSGRPVAAALQADPRCRRRTNAHRPDGLYGSLQSSHRPASAGGCGGLAWRDLRYPRGHGEGARFGGAS